MEKLARFAILLSAIFSFNLLSAQSISMEVNGGTMIGSPFGEIPEGATGAPGVDAYGGLTATWNIRPRWGIRTGAIYARQKAEYASPIAGTTRVSRDIFGIPFTLPFNVGYEGNVEGAYDNHYIGFPLTVVFNTKKRFSFLLGGYAANLIQGSHTGSVDLRVARLFNVTDEPFDETELLDKWDLGATAGVEFQIWKNLSAGLRTIVGLKNINTENPEGLEGVYRNVYMGIGLQYKLFQIQL